MLSDSVLADLTRQASVWAYAQVGLVYGVSNPNANQQATINRLASARYEQLKQAWLAKNT